MKDDLISRQAAINALSVAQADLHNAHAVGLIRAQKIISDLPSAPQRTGRWELIDDTEFRIPGYRCSVCHCECEDRDKKPTYRFCPHCGARMEEEK